MGRRENFYNTLKHHEPEKLIVDFGGNPLSGMEGNSMYSLLEFLGYDVSQDKTQKIPFGKLRKLDERLLKYFDIDTRSVGSILAPRKSQYRKISDDEYIDEWGVQRVYTGMYWDINRYPLKGASVDDLEHFEWPEAESIDNKEVEKFAAEAKKLFEETDYIICAEHPVYGIFELGCWMCGFEDFLMKMVIDEAFVRKFFEIVLNYQKKVIDIYYGALGKYIHYTSSGDDFATQTGLFTSPEMFKRLIKPYFKERIKHTKKYTDAAYLHHSCGSVFPIIGELVDCRVDILNPIQPQARDMEPEFLKEKYGGAIVFHGGIDTQEVLPYGTKESIEEHVKKVIGVLKKDGGYIFAAAHNIQEDVPPQNLVYMFDAARKYGRGGNQSE